VCELLQAEGPLADFPTHSTTPAPPFAARWHGALQHSAAIVVRISCRVCAGYRAVRDTVPCGIPCRAGYQCRAGYRAVRDTVPTESAAVRVRGMARGCIGLCEGLPLGWAPCQGRSPHARTGFRSVRRKWAPLSAAVAWKHRLSGANSVAGEQRILSSYAFRRARDMADPKATRAQLDRLRRGAGLGR
jgi:hypothetical protein